MTSSTENIYPWQQAQWRHILRQREEGRLPHACLFTGPAGTGKIRFARVLAQSLLCAQPVDGMVCGECASCRLVQAGTHPDMHHLQPAPPEKSTSKHPVMLIRIDPMRELCRRLAETSQFQGYRCAVIEQAEKMTTEAANSLLKTLEEPGADALILLVTAHPNRLPVTVRSRCQQLRFPVPERATAEQWMQQSGHAEAARSLPLVHDSPLKALSWSEASGEGHALLVEALTASQSGKDPLALSAKLADLPKEDTLSWLQDVTADVIRLATLGGDCELVNEASRAALEARAGRADSRRLYLFQDQVNELVRSGGIALNAQLMWENLLLSWDNL